MAAEDAPPIEFSERHSLILRYSNTLSREEARLARRVSLHEGARIVGPSTYRGVRLYFLDLSSYSETGTFKDTVACVTVMHCVQRGIPALLTQTSGNTGNALARYASSQGIRCVILYPRISRYKIDARLAASPLDD